MGKIYQTQQQLQDQLQENQTQTWLLQGLLCCDCCSKGLFVGIRNSCSFKCVLILILSVSLLLSAVFWIPPFNRFKLKSGFDANAADTINVKARFRLQKSVSELVADKETLQADILGEIGLPNTKVSVLSMHQAAASNWTDVVFGVLPDQDNAPINLVSLSVLRSSLVELFLHRLNLSLTTSIFGKSSSFEILAFSGGINVVPLPSAFVSKMPQALFNFTLNNSISQIEVSFDRFRDQLKFGLSLKPYENVYVQLRNANGSTVEPPVIVEASVLSDVGSHYLLPQRLKQLAQTITKSPPAKNLGLDHSVFGKVKGISLSSILNHTLQSSPSPSPSPSPYPSPSSSPSISPSVPPSPSDGSRNSAPHQDPSRIAPAPSGDHQDLSPCSHCGISFPYAPVPAFGPQPPLAPYSESPAPLIPTDSPRQSPCHGSTVSPSPVPTNQFYPSSPPSLSPHASVPSPLPPTEQLTPDFPPSSTIFQGISPDQGRTSVLPASSPISPFPSSSGPSSHYKGTWLIGLLLLLPFHLLHQPN